MFISRTTRLLAPDRPASRHHPVAPGRPKRAVLARIGRLSSAAVSALVIAALALVGAPKSALAHSAAASEQWRLQTSPAQPPAGIVAGNMAADPANGTVVLFGPSPAFCGPSTCTDQTWTWDGTSWTQQHPRHHPSARGSAALAFDPTTSTVVLFGGWNVDFTANPPGLYFGDTWTWNGTDWTEQHPAHLPGARLTGLVTDPATSRVLLQGGQHYDPSRCGVDQDGPVGCFFEPVLDSAGRPDTWTWNGTDWTQLNPVHEPSLVEAGSLASDPATGTVVAFGGGSPEIQLSDTTWTWDGNDWTQQHPRHHPSARTANGLAYDPATGSVILFGGELALPFGNVSGETWTWDGRDWKQQHGHESPSPRRLPGMATDPATCSVVLFGGDVPHPDFSSTNLDDTWVYASSPGSPGQFDQHAAPQHDHQGAPNCSPGEN
jgi:hypothetical protein